MGYASHEGRAWAIRQLLKLTPEPVHFLDLGAGAGSWMEAVRPWFLASKWIAMEAWEPYIRQFCLYERYSLVIQGDIRHQGFPKVDVVILGDVLEHMNADDSAYVWDRARKAARMAVIASSPIVHYPQGHVHGNPFQEHLQEDLTIEKLTQFSGVLDPEGGHYAGNAVGTIWAKGLA